MLRVLILMWRPLLFSGVVLAGLAAVLGVFASSGWPAWIFALGAGLAVLGVAGLLADLALRAKDKIEDVLDGDDDAPAGPAPPPGPRIDAKRPT